MGKGGLVVIHPNLTKGFPNRLQIEIKNSPHVKFVIHDQFDGVYKKLSTGIKRRAKKFYLNF